VSIMQDKEYRKLVISLLVVFSGAAMILTSDFVIRTYFPNRPLLDDVMFRILPYWPWLAKVADGIIVAGMFVVAIFTQGKLSRMSQVLFAFGFMMFFRGILNAVTPIGDPSGDTTVYGFLERYPLVGMFPSGHTASLVLEYWLLKLWDVGATWKLFFLLLIIAEIFVLLVTHGHYSIDIVGGIVLGYFAVVAAKRYG